MEIRRYRELCMQLKERFPSSYPHEVLNRAWTFWRDIPSIVLDALIRQAIDTSLPFDVLLEGERIWPEHKPKPIPEKITLPPGMHIQSDEKERTSIYSKRIVGAEETLKQIHADEIAAEKIDRDSLSRLQGEHGAESLWDLIERTKKKPG